MIFHTNALVGLGMNVPGSWWNKSDNSRTVLHLLKIHSIDFDQIENQNYLRFQSLDNVDEPELYLMRYDAVLAYADECSSSPYSSFRLSVELVPHPVNETARQNCKEYIWTKPESWAVLKRAKMEEPLNPFHTLEHPVMQTSLLSLLPKANQTKSKWFSFTQFLSLKINFAKFLII